MFVEQAIIQPGTTTLGNDQDTKEGLLILTLQDYVVLLTSGNFSVQATGFLIEGGKIVRLLT